MVVLGLLFFGSPWYCANGICLPFAMRAYMYVLLLLHIEKKIRVELNVDVCILLINKSC